MGAARAGIRPGEATIEMADMSEARGLWDRIGELLFANELEPTVSNFDICRRYVLGIDEALVASVDQAIARHGGLTRTAVASLVALHSRAIATDEIIRFAQQARAKADEAATVIGEAQGVTRRFADALEAGATTLATGAGAEVVIADLLAETRLMTERAWTAEDRIRKASEEIHDLRTRLAEASVTANSDPLTGLPNRRALEARLRLAYDAAKEQSRTFSLAICDIDHFKRINDTHGHPIGDQVIKLIASSLSKVGSDSLFVARYGGEEFVVVFDDAEPEEAMSRLDMIRADVAARQVTVRRTGETVGRVTFSSGIAGMRGRRDTSAMLKAADEALYRAKSEGRNRICVA
ncbi:diguanylate cyclase [Sphingomonas laterariae]|uniref:diguanylate cyclase n=1 Tax=Edaphosphingomonas laterariae TaxID=861865 RepID=A0A239HIB5_9SPHN|nr:GGDEF domain-containing protein [Sphingomonas laterariae]SNS81139.1 diguanylate cyclase [Sphingomonas laterariae]